MHRLPSEIIETALLTALSGIGSDEYATARGFRARSRGARNREVLYVQTFPASLL